MNLLVTGGAGFIGSNFLQFIYEKHPDWTVVNVDRLTYAGNLENIAHLSNWDNYSFIKADVCDKQVLDKIFEQYQFDAVIHFAAESHVDRSILEADEFIRTNIYGTYVLLELSRKHQVKRFLNVSTDEVYGSLGPTGYFTELTPLAPNSPYSASKASADMLARAAFHTYKQDIVITRCSNNYGPYQFPEKLIPLMIHNALHDKPLPVYGDGRNVRDWIHVKDHCEALLTVLLHGEAGEVYNIGGNNEQENITIVKKILAILNKSEALIQFVKDRPGHDKRYAIDATKIRIKLKWEPKIPFEQGLFETVEWYVKNQTWVNKVITGEYLQYYEKQYSQRIKI
ncbi:MAG: dTDP-glucose 4,6-dehydratase [bacterium]|nr:dTDP-glucose 4,6-dehydratase [bacterium]